MFRKISVRESRSRETKVALPKMLSHEKHLLHVFLATTFLRMRSQTVTVTL
jgi:hypothetical protein